MKWLIVVFIAFAVSCLWWLDAERGTVHSRQDDGSTLERGPKGLSLARAYLDEVAERRSSLLTRSLAQAQLPENAVVLRIVPGESELQSRTKKVYKRDDVIEKPTWPDDEPWVSRGGRLVVAFQGTGEAFKSTLAANKPTVVLPILPRITTVIPAQYATLTDEQLLEATPIITVGSRVLVARRQVGAGEVWLVACPEIFTNQHLLRGDHAALLLALVGTQRPVWFDEKIHDVVSYDGLVMLLRRWGLGPALAIGVLLVVLWFWRGRVLLGPPADPWRDHRAEAVEGVDALAGLYHRALSRRELIDLYRQRLLREVIWRTGQRPLTARTTVDRLTAGLRLPAGALGEADFLRMMNRINQAFRSLRDEYRR